MDIKKLTLNELAAVADNAREILIRYQAANDKPNPHKTAPTFTAPYIADLCKFEKANFHNKAMAHGLPLGEKREDTKARIYSLDDVITWAKAVGNFVTRPEGKQGRVVVSCNYKGGVAKTTTVVSLAQALTLRGLTVCLIDLDPQATATGLLGINAERVIDDDETVMPLIYGDQADLNYGVVETYWKNLHMIPAAANILAAEFVLPSRAVRDKSIQYWKILANGITPLRERFDVILIDTAPSLSHTTMNAMMAADGLIMPCPPAGLDFASSVQFWGLFSELAAQFPGASEKEFDFMTVVQTKVNTTDSSRLLVKRRMQQAYGEHMNPIEIPASKAITDALDHFKTIYDMPKAAVTHEAQRRYKEPVDKLAEYVLEQLAISWST